MLFPNKKLSFDLRAKQQKKCLFDNILLIDFGLMLWQKSFLSFSEILGFEKLTFRFTNTSCVLNPQPTFNLTFYIYTKYFFYPKLLT